MTKRPGLWPRWGPPLFTAILAAAVSPAEPEPLGGTVLQPAAHIAHERIGECSGIVWLDGAYYVHNDSGDEPVIYRSPALDFAQAEVLALPGAQAIDWEDIAVLDGDLLIGDIGDNRRQRAYVVLYRARYVPAVGDRDARLDLVAIYPFRYPDMPHDAEALVVIDGRVHVISKYRGEAPTGVYRFEELRDEGDLPAGELNEPRLLATLDIGEGERITAGDYHARTGTVVLLTYTHLLCYPRDYFTGAPEARTLISARQCEALCFAGETLVFANEERDVYAIEGFMDTQPPALLPPFERAALPRYDPAAAHRDWREVAANVPLRDIVEGEWLRWALMGDRLRVAGRLEHDESITPCKGPGSADALPGEEPLGSALLLAFGSEARLDLGPHEVILAVGVDPARDARVWRTDLMAEPTGLAPLESARITGSARDGVVSFELDLPVAELWGDVDPETWRFAAHGYRLRAGAGVRFGGPDLYAVLRPYTWGEVVVHR